MLAPDLDAHEARLIEEYCGDGHVLQKAISEFRMIKLEMKSVLRIMGAENNSSSQPEGVCCDGQSRAPSP